VSAVALHAEIPLPVQVFIVAVVLALWRRESGSTNAATPWRQ
jgi:hypothetical protein